jgi:hypothetical protein
MRGGADLLRGEPSNDVQNCGTGHHATFEPCGEGADRAAATFEPCGEGADRAAATFEPCGEAADRAAATFG